MERLDDIRRKIYHYYDEEYLRKILLNFNSQILDSSNFNIENKNVNKILNHFFEDLIFRSKSKNGRYSPHEMLTSDKLLYEALCYIDCHPNFYHNKSDEANLRDFFFSSSKVGKVTNFNPVLARKIYERYIPFYGATIFDFSCGFGSRLLGALSSKYNYRYIGTDPYKELYLRLLKFSSWILTTLHNEASSKIYNLGSEVFIPQLINQIDLSFSSPPYFDYERYTESKTQSYIMFPTYDEWLKGYVVPTLKNIFEYTKDGGFHIVNLQDIKNTNLVSDWIDIASLQGFELDSIEYIPTLKRSSAKNENKLLVMKKSC